MSNFFSIKGSVAPVQIKKINDIPSQYQVEGIAGTFNECDLGVYVKHDEPFFQKKDCYSLFDLDYSFSGEFPQINFTVEYMRDDKFIKSTVFGLFKNGTNRPPVLINTPKDFPESVGTKVFNLLMKENLFEVSIFGFDRLSDEVKIENAKRFEALHKEPFFAHLEGVENALDEEYLDLWEEHIQDKVSGDIFSEEMPYVEVSSHESKSGHSEIFEPALGDDEDVVFAEEALPILGWSLFSVMAELGSYDDFIIVDDYSNTVLFWAEEILDEKDIFKRCKFFKKLLRIKFDVQV